MTPTKNLIKVQPTSVYVAIILIHILLLLLSVEVKLDTEQDRDYLQIYTFNKIYFLENIKRSFENILSYLV